MTRAVWTAKPRTDDRKCRRRLKYYLRQPGNGFLRCRQAGFQIIERIVRLGLIFQGQCPVRRKSDLPERLEYGDNVEVTFAEHNVFRLFAELGVVFQMHAMDSMG